MKRRFLVLLLSLFVTGPLVADDATVSDKPTESVAEKLKANPGDQAALNAYMNENFRRLAAIVDVKPDEAEKQVKEMTALLESLSPESEPAKQQLTRAKSAVANYSQRIELARTTFEELEKRIQANADDVKSLSSFVSKLTQEIGPLTRSQPEVAEQKLKAGRRVLDNAKSQAKQDSTKQLIDRHSPTFAQLEKSIDAGKKLTALIGTAAAPIDVAAWVNGAPLTDSDLKGKVVLLDFWAVWCGPCIATFPHLREWQEKYADKGLVVIGMTRYYNYDWNDETGRATRSQEKVAPEQEQKMLVRFAEQHTLRHRFAIQTDNRLAEFYGVTGIPHVVLIDRNGKVQLIRVGSGEQNARDLSQMLDKLLAAGT